MYILLILLSSQSEYNPRDYVDDEVKLLGHASSPNRIKHLKIIADYLSALSESILLIAFVTISLVISWLSSDKHLGSKEFEFE